MRNYNVMLVDDHPFLRAGLREVIKENKNYTVVSEASDKSEAIQEFTDKLPDVVVLDINLGSESGLDLIKPFRDMKESVGILVLSMYEDYEYLIKAFSAGADGYVVKGAATDIVLSGISIVAGRNVFLGPKMAGIMVQRMLEKGSCEFSEEENDRYETLTDREQEIFRLLVNGLTSKQIGKELYISSKTVDNHKSKIMSKLEVHNSVGLFRFATKIGLLDS
ncbi:MAG: response regulator transcription factor [Spirochaetales bacterium]|nr:response regulator transcription factor [Spirochaetales bacterium]